MAAITSMRSKIESYVSPIVNKIPIEKVKKVAMALLIVLGLLLAEIGDAFLEASFPLFGIAIIAMSIGLIAIAILKIKAQRNSDS